MIALSIACAALALAACKKDAEPRTLLPVDVSAPAGASVQRVRILVTRDGSQIKDQEFNWRESDGGTLKAGVFLSDDVSGQVLVTAFGYGDGDKFGWLSRPGTATIVPGKVSDVLKLKLEPAEPERPDAGATDTAGPADAPPEAAPAPPVDAGGGAETAPDTGPPGPVERSWQPAQNIEKDLLNQSRRPSIAMNRATGDVLIAWHEYAGAIRISRYDAATQSWGEPRAVVDGGRPVNARIALASGGQAMLFWADATNPDESKRGMWAARSTDGGKTWPALVQVRQHPNPWNVTQLVMAENGDARAVWNENGMGALMNQIWSAAFVAASGTWGAPVLVSRPPAEGNADEESALAGDDAGNGLIVWQQAGKAWGATWKGATLEPGQLIGDASQETISSPTAAMAPKGGRAIAIWQQNGATWANELIAGAWKGPARVASAFLAGGAALIDATGVLTVVRGSYSVTSRYNVVAARQEGAAKPWMLMPLETNNQAMRAEDAPYPSLAADPLGNVHVTWSRRVSALGFAPIVRSFLGGRLRDERDLGSKVDTAVSDPVVAVANDGSAVAAFHYVGEGVDPGLFNIFVALYR